MANSDNIKLISRKIVEKDEQIYQIVDFLNKSLKEKNLIFGLCLKDSTKMEISIYES
ncbi:YpmA family protein [Irregularibacter muris]|uniref:YpmA family protein n=1 Tax=Irregularibacter muris TaxID=1796619 RepID=A0AAE3HEJ5_9FIRM|nr:YpmA family protein [Irregularibacter muris]MCR1898055.1 YpmA family protein [Irregularibacter muris]